MERRIDVRNDRLSNEAMRAGEHSCLKSTALPRGSQPNSSIIADYRRDLLFSDVLAHHT